MPEEVKDIPRSPYVDTPRPDQITAVLYAHKFITPQQCCFLPSKMPSGKRKGNFMTPKYTELDTRWI